MSRLLHAAAQARQPTYGWLIACDDARVTAHLGVAELSHSYEYAKKALNELIDWHIAVATDPAVNGGQTALEPTPWREMVVATLVREGINKHRARELADHFAAQRPWVGLTEKDWEYVKDSKGTSLDTFDHGAAWAADQLMKRNT